MNKKYIYKNMKLNVRNKKIIIFLLIFLIKVMCAEIITNPKLILSEVSHPMVYSGDEYNVIITYEKITQINKDSGEVISSSEELTDFFVIDPCVLMIDESKNCFFYSHQNGFYQIIFPTSYNILSENPKIPSNIGSYIGAITEYEHAKEKDESNYCRCEILKDEIILYGIKINIDYPGGGLDGGRVLSSETIIFFSFVKANQLYEINVDFDIDNYKISCKSIASSRYLCALISDNFPKLILINYHYLNGECTIAMQSNHKDLLDISQPSDFGVYDTNANNKKIVCFIKYSESIMICILVTIEIDEECYSTSNEVNYNLGENDENRNQVPFNCYTDCSSSANIGNELFICCAGDDSINCAIINVDDITSMKYFVIYYTGTIAYLNILSDGSTFYNIFFWASRNYYEYLIYKPTCNNVHFQMVIYGSMTKDLDSLFNRKINGEYSIKFENLPNDYGNLYIEENLIDNIDNKYILEENKNIKIESINEQVTNEYKIKFKIIIFEFESPECFLNLTVLPCYDSCNRCTSSKFESDSSNHNCEENNCKNNYYPSPLSSTNCFMESEKETNWFLDTSSILIKFALCDTNCASCSDTSTHCLTCNSKNTNPLAYLYNNHCINECPEGTFSLLKTGDYYECKNCYINCKTCEEEGNDDNMQCKSCNDNNIKYNTNCYIEADSSQKTFYKPHSTTDITSCYQEFHAYIIENTYECIDSMPDQGYYLSNTNTGLLVQCHPDCKTCSNKFNSITTNCDSCNNENYFLLDGNCISSCPEGYYSSLIDNIKLCESCGQNCIPCDSGIDYNDTSNLTNNYCIACNNYYTKKEENISMCYSKETIEEGYFLNTSLIPFQWEKCYEKCSTCNSKGNSDKMACLSCKTNYIDQEINKLVYLKLSKKNCIIGCPPNLFLTNELNCVESCLNDTYEYSPNKTCLTSCPNNFIIDSDNNRCIFSSFENNTPISDFKEIIYSNITYFLKESNKLLEFFDFTAYIQPVNNLDPIEQINKGISGLDLGDCVDVLKNNYNISENEDLIIIETESNQNKKYIYNNNEKEFILGKDVKISITDIQGNILNLSYCNNKIEVIKYIGDTKEIKIDIISEYAKKGINILDASDSFFNDKCHYYDLDLDIIIKDRREDIFQNVSFCEDNCVFKGINYTRNTSTCLCDAYNLQDDFVKNDEDDDGFEKITINNMVNSFTSQIFVLNWDVVKCYNLVFDQKILKKNKGFFAYVAMTVVQIGVFAFFLIKKIKPIRIFMVNLSKLYPPKKKKISININIDDMNDNNLDNKENINVVNGFKIYTQKEIDRIHGLKTESNNNDIKNKSKKNNKITDDNNEAIISYESIGSKELELNRNEEQLKKNVNETKNKKNLYTNKYEKYNDMKYDEALATDKRNIFQMYLAFLFQNHIIFNTFFAEIYLELRNIKIGFFIFGLEISFFLNAIFYTDKYISDTYHNNGILNFFSSLPKAIYSFIVTTILSLLLKMLSNSKKQLIKIIEEKDKNPNYIKDVESELNKLHKKLYIYFILVFILGIAFTYYCSAFCAVYINSQTFWLIGCLESFALDLLIPFIICLVLAGIRYISINEKLNYLYKIYSLMEKIL